MIHCRHVYPWSAPSSGRWQYSVIFLYNFYKLGQVCDYIEQTSNIISNVHIPALVIFYYSRIFHILFCSNRICKDSITHTFVIFKCHSVIKSRQRIIHHFNLPRFVLTLAAIRRPEGEFKCKSWCEGFDIYTVNLNSIGIAWFFS